MGYNSGDSFLSILSHMEFHLVRKIEMQNCHIPFDLTFDFESNFDFPFDNFEPNGIPFGSKSKGKLSLITYPIQFERKRKYSFLSV